MVKKSKKIYCVFCGNENNQETEFCSKCQKKLNPKNSLFKAFLYEHIKDDLKDKITDTLFSYLKNYLISHLYGVAMSVAIVFTTATIIVNISGHYKVVSDVSQIKNKAANTNEVTIRVYTYDDSCANDFDPELADIPFSTAGAISGLRRTIQEITIKKGTSITDYCQNNHEKELICSEPLALYSEYKNNLETSAQEYRKKVLEYAAWVHETGAKNSNEYAKWNRELDNLSNNIFNETIKEYDKNKSIKEATELYVSDIGCLYE